MLFRVVRPMKRDELSRSADFVQRIPSRYDEPEL